MTKDKLYENTIKMDLGCIEWKSYVNKHGYGHALHNKKMWSVHRLSYLFNFGEIPKSKWVLHKCDNRKCINPEHLYLGDCKQNVKDRVNRNRGAIASRNASTKLTVEQVKEIKRLDGTLKSISIKFGVAIATIDDIKRERSWKHV